MMTFDEALATGREENWDGFGSLALSPEVIRNSKILHKLLHTSDVEPSPNGTVSFNLDDACLEVGKTRFSGYFKDVEKTIFFEGNFFTRS